MDRGTLLEVFNEVCCLILMYHLLCFTDFLPDAEFRYYLGYSYVFFAVGNISIHLLLIIVDNIVKIIEKLKENKAKK